MMKLIDLVEFISGSPQFRITETADLTANIYTFYGQQDLLNDLYGMQTNGSDSKQTRTHDQVSVLNSGDVIFSLISGQATIVSNENQGYIYTQNYVRLEPIAEIDARFLVYLLNENQEIKKQLAIGLQGSQVLKYTVKQLRELEIPILPSLEKQEIVGDVYFKQLKLEALKKKTAQYETQVVLAILKGEF
ncbi:MAG: restriction endonuclease subunit S [Culicoidibacterales bacterium]